MKKITIRKMALFVLSFGICGIMSAQNYKIVDTDVTDFYNDSAVIIDPSPANPYYGQDAHYNGYQPSYTDNSDGTVTDNVTGLMWQQDMGSKMSYADAVTAAGNATTGGYTDWRIPTIKELFSLIYYSGNCNGNDVAIKYIDTNYFNQPIGNTGIGEREIDAQTWSSTHYVGLTMGGDSTLFGVNFVDGRLKGYPKYEPANGTTPKTMYFRMVRGNTAYGINDFADNGDGTITDNATGLMWQQADDGNTYNWKEALAYAESLSLAGHSDWRLPNIKELQSIVDYSRARDITNSAAIDPLFSATSFTDPDGVSGQYGYYWSSSPLLDGFGMNTATSACYIPFGEAQGKMNGNLMDVHGAGSVRSDPKSGNSADYPDFFGPQGDVRYVFNYVRAVRSLPGTNGVKEINKESLNWNVYPNPSRGEVNIVVEEPNATLEIVNELGQFIYRSSGQASNLKIQLTPGIYIAKLYSHDSINVRKIVITE